MVFFSTAPGKSGALLKLLWKLIIKIHSKLSFPPVRIFPFKSFAIPFYQWGINTSLCRLHQHSAQSEISCRRASFITYIVVECPIATPQRNLMASSSSQNINSQCSSLELKLNSLIDELKHSSDSPYGVQQLSKELRDTLIQLRTKIQV